MKDLPLGYYWYTLQFDGCGFTPQEPQGKAGRHLPANSYCAPPHRRGKRNWLRQRHPGDCPVAGIGFFFIQSRLKIAILLIKTHVSKSFMLQSETKRNGNDQRLFQGLISLCALYLQSTCKHNRNHRTECVQHRARAQTLPKNARSAT